MKVRMRKTRIHTNISATAFAYIEEIMKRDIILGRNSVFEAAAKYIKTIENKITTEIVKEILRKTSGDAKVLFHPTMTDETLGAVNRISEKHKLNKGEAMEIIINLYMDKYKALNGETLKIKKVIEPKIENFTLERSADKILFALYVRYPVAISFDEIIGLIPEAGLANTAENSEIEFKAELQLYVKKGYIQMIRSGTYIRYIITEFGISYLVKKAVVDVQARINSMIVALRGYIENGEEFRYEKVIYELLLEEEHKLTQPELARRTGIKSVNMSISLQKVVKKKLVIVDRICKGKSNMVILDLNKLLIEGLPPRNAYDYKILKMLMDIGGVVRVSTLNTALNTKNNTHINRVLKAMQKKGLVILNINLGRKGTSVTLTEDGKSFYHLYLRKNIELKTLDVPDAGKKRISDNSKLGRVKKKIVKIIEKRSGVITGFDDIKKCLKEESIILADYIIKRYIGNLGREGYIKEVYVLGEKKV